MKRFLPLAAGLCLAVLACNQSQNDRNNETEKDIVEISDSAKVYGDGSSSAAVQNNADSVHRFIRTADLKFKVADVAQATYRIEDVVNTHGGFVTLTQLNSNNESEMQIPISQDSAVETTRFSVVNTMTIRVPNIKLDTTLKDIAKMVGYLDYRIIKADDVGLQIRANVLQQKRNTKQAARLTNIIDAQGHKVLETTAAEETLQDKEAKADEAMLSNLSLADQVNFSTVQLSIYQRPTVLTKVVAVEKEVTAYEPHFGMKVLAALQNGFEILEMLFIGLLQIWPVLLLACLCFWLYKKYKMAHPTSIATPGK